MSSEKLLPMNYQSGKQRMLRYAIATVNAVTLLGSILFVTWILGKIIGALHALVFSLAFAGNPDQPPKAFPILEEAITRMEVQSILQDAQKSQDSAALYTLDRKNWGQ